VNVGTHAASLIHSLSTDVDGSVLLVFKDHSVHRLVDIDPEDGFFVLDEEMEFHEC